MNKKKIFTFLIFSVLILIILNYLIFSVIIPSKHSVTLVCQPEVAEREGLRVGATTTSVINETTQEIMSVVVFFTPPTKKRIKHEGVHVNQNERKFWFSGSCVFPIQKFFREAEAYIGQDLPDRIYKTIYGEINQEVLVVS